MLETKEQKQLFSGTIALIVILLVVSIWHKPASVQQSAVKSGMTVAQAQAYLDYLNSIKTDPQASKQLFQTILTQDDIRKEVVDTLQADKPAQVPTLDVNKIKTTASNDAQSVENYLSQSIGKVNDFNTETLDLHQNLFGTNVDAASQLKNKLTKLSSDLYNLKVPTDALTMHKALLTALASYNSLVNAAGVYNPDDYTQNDTIWPTVYNSFAVASSTAGTYNSELQRLASKYKISEIQIPKEYAKGGEPAWFNPLAVPKAQAVFGIGDFVFNTTIGDLAQIVFRAVDYGFTSAFLQFMSNMLNKFLVQIEKNYAIANFLYYNDVLGEVYTEDYLNKYATPNNQLTPIDQQIIKTFIPAFSCGQPPPDLRQYMTIKSQTYLGFDPQGLDPNDPNYYQKMQKAGSLLSSPVGWNLYYQDLASAAESASQQSVNQELFSSGLKTPRNTSDTSIGRSINAIVASEQGAFINLFNITAPNAQDPLSGIIAQLTQNLANQFIFQGVGGAQGGSVGVLKEQPVCINALQLNPVVGVGASPYPNTGIVPTTEDATAVSCSYQSSVTTDCTDSIITYLNKCVSSPNTTDHQTCVSVANSTYVKSLEATCPPNPSPFSTCGRIEGPAATIGH